MLSRVLELWEQVPDAAERIGADHVAVLEEAVRAAELAGEDDRGIMLAQAALREIDTAAEPVRAALMLRTRGYLKYHLGRTGLRRGPGGGGPPGARPTRRARRGPGCSKALAHYTLKVHGGWDRPRAPVGRGRSGGRRAAGRRCRHRGGGAGHPGLCPTSRGNVERIREMLAEARAVGARPGPASRC